VPSLPLTPLPGVSFAPSPSLPLTPLPGAMLPVPSLPLTPLPGASLTPSPANPARSVSTPPPPPAATQAAAAPSERAVRTSAEKNAELLVLPDNFDVEKDRKRRTVLAGVVIAVALALIVGVAVFFLTSESPPQESSPEPVSLTAKQRSAVQTAGAASVGTGAAMVRFHLATVDVEWVDEIDEIDEIDGADSTEDGVAGDDPAAVAVTWTVEVTSTPPGAVVYDGKTKLGTTPTTVELTSATPVSLRLRLRGYKTETVVIPLNDGTLVTGVLSPRPADKPKPGSMRIAP